MAFDEDQVDETLPLLLDEIRGTLDEGCFGHGKGLQELGTPAEVICDSAAMKISDACCKVGAICWTMSGAISKHGIGDQDTTIRCAMGRRTTDARAVLPPQKGYRAGRRAGWQRHR